MAVFRADKVGGSSERWIARWYDSSRKLRQRTFDTKRQAEDYEHEQSKAGRQFAPGSVADSEIKVAAYAEKWIKQVAASAKERTVENYSANLRLHILPQWGEIKVREIHRNAVKAWVTRLRETLSPGTASLLLSILGTFCTAAIDDGIIPANPCAGVGKVLKLAKAVRLANRDDSGERETKAFTAEELRAVLAQIKADYPREFPLFAFLARSGCRIGEALGLKWADLGRDEVTVSRQRTRGRIETPKGGDARVVHLTDHPDLTAAAPVLADVPTILRHAEVAEKAAALKRGQPVSEFCFVTSTGHPENESNVRRILSRAAAKAQVSRLSPHAFRHSFGSLLLSAGESPEYVSRQMGHADLKITISTYGRWLPTRSTRAAAPVARPESGKVIPFAEAVSRDHGRIMGVGA
jgi:integrase